MNDNMVTKKCECGKEHVVDITAYSKSECFCKKIISFEEEYKQYRAKEGVVICQNNEGRVCQDKEQGLNQLSTHGNCGACLLLDTNKRIIELENKINRTVQVTTGTNVILAKFLNQIQAMQNAKAVNGLGNLKTGEKGPGGSIII